MMIWVYRSDSAAKKMVSLLYDQVRKESGDAFDPLEESLDGDLNRNIEGEGEDVKGRSAFQRIMAQMKDKANQSSRDPVATVENVVDSYLASKLSNNSLSFWAKFEADSKGCKIKMALVRVAKRHLTPHPTSTNVERLFSTASNVLEGRRLNTESFEKLVFLKENLKLQNFALDW